MRALLPKGTPFVAMSATLPARVRNDVLTRLQYDLDSYIFLNLGNDRPNVSIVVRAIQNAMNTYSDLDFLLNGVKKPEDIKKTFIYSDSVISGIEIEDRLYGLTPNPSFREAGVIRPYSAAFSSEHRGQLMELFKAGVIRILICTDAAGMVS